MDVLLSFLLSSDNFLIPVAIYIPDSIGSVPLFPIKAEGASEGTFGHNGFTGCNVTVIPAKKQSSYF